MLESLHSKGSFPSSWITLIALSRTNIVTEHLKTRVFKSELQGTTDGLIFTHADLHPRNILIGEDGGITGIIDWETAGWYPRYWERVKALNRTSFTKGTMRIIGGEFYRRMSLTVRNGLRIFLFRVRGRA